MRKGEENVFNRYKKPLEAWELMGKDEQGKCVMKSGETLTTHRSLSMNMFVCWWCGEIQQIRHEGTVLVLHGMTPCEVRLIGPEDSCILLNEAHIRAWSFIGKGHWNTSSPHFCDWRCFEGWAKDIVEKAKLNMKTPRKDFCLDTGGLGRKDRTPLYDHNGNVIRKESSDDSDK